MNNWEKIDKLEIENNISISCFRTKQEIISEHYNLGIIFSSLESRALEYGKLFSGKTFDRTLLVKFDFKEKDNLKNDLENYQKLKKISKKGPIVINNLILENIKYNIKKIIINIPKESLNLNSRWFLDMTGAPLVYSIAILGFLKKIFPAPNIHLLNVSGIYKNSDVINNFTKGFNEDIWIPFFIGKPDFKSPSLYIFLLGFEGDRALSIYKKCDPVYVKAIIADPGYCEGYKKIALKKNRYFLKEVNIEPRSVTTADVGNPIEVFKKVKKIVNRYKKSYEKINTVFVPVGPKPHALGAAIGAIEDSTISILYEIPLSYTLKEVERGNYIWLYEINF
jgi:hypothetical protein